MSKTVRTGGGANRRASAASRPQAAASSTRKRSDEHDERKRSDARSAREAAGGNVPSTLDPDLTEPAEDIDAELAQIDRERHEPPDQALPEELIGEDVERAAERLPAGVPVDKADRTDEREERPPSAPKID
ncbi:hypothetical protein LMG31506_03495 [Cupriavidus yeoncheonensis]|uniref:Uncharacterized protein n=1 Tax=Cupriavidus yeoncheonensis TaxID=1462994 RepID=A0A916IYH7_9BURK|nr:hypothetical protein [Cupriavidus yeoncheonensis]CAG2146881.1 hypothetical protein LMG31506_03495 [Cupriavidus yeoncheonensis]